MSPDSPRQAGQRIVTGQIAFARHPGQSINRSMWENRLRLYRANAGDNNGQSVIRRTDTPGNDRNQVVYELECGGCGHRYGANGADIWQRKCPTCGAARPGLDYS